MHTENTVHEGDLLWTPDSKRLEQAGLTDFIHWLNLEFDAGISDYQSLWQWSVEDVGRFWSALTRKYEVLPDAVSTTALVHSAMPGAKWFPDATVNFTQYLLRQGESERVAVYVESESTGHSQLSWSELRRQVVQLATYLRDRGVGPGDHVCFFLPVSCESVVGLLATASIGAIWSSCSPDFGSKSVCERFSQVSPKVLVAVSGYHYNGKYCDRGDDLRQIIESLGSLEEVIYLPWTDRAAPRLPVSESSIPVSFWDVALDNDAQYDNFTFEPLSFSHPIWVLYTSGTTGLPKGIVHGHGGVLLEFVKSGRLHDDLNPRSTKFFFTTTGWTMFNLLVGGLVTGGAIVLYDGCPTFPAPSILFDISERCGVTYFGANPTFINGLIAHDYSPRQSHDLSRVRTIALTGSPSSPETFKWFYDNFHADLHVVSMSGGTDVVAAFVGGCPLLPVHAGEIQSPCLAVDARAFDEQGNTILDQDGELVILQPMPSMPLYFLNDKSDERYRSSYFDMYPGIWRQGDLIRFRSDGRNVISGRSDSTLNRSGIRLGTSEIYRTVEAIDGIQDSLIVNLELPGAKFFMPLFVVLDEGVALDHQLVSRIAETLRSECSPRHVPDKVYAIAQVPYTLSGKKLEVPVKRLLAGMPLEKASNPGACRNPGALDYFVEFSRTIAKEL